MLQGSIIFTFQTFSLLAKHPILKLGSKAVDLFKSNLTLDDFYVFVSY